MTASKGSDSNSGVRKKRSVKSAKLVTIGWREWVGLPELEVPRVKVKVDTGARTSALHAVKLKAFEQEGREWVSFVVHPLQDSLRGSVNVSVPVHDWRNVKSSNGKSERRPIILTRLTLGERTWPIELSLTRRDNMGFRMLLGRQALSRRVLVDTGRSFLVTPDIPPKEGNS